jgi:LytS/YehU family sensor histidine kinase
MTGQLAALMRTSLDQHSTPLVALEDELRTVRDYLRYTIAIDDAARSVRVPRMSIQTIVENSVKYAVSPRREGATLRISAVAEARETAITISDDGPGFANTALPPGHGLALLKERLALLFPGDQRLTIASGTTGSRVVLRVPKTHEVAYPTVERSRGRA